ncbi:MAG: sulfatase-like hydrolase/transferase [Phycisphaerae bacterium]|nr:sulfatase-like hydrolase/transferase [Phycisphaerae bacterium]
MSESGLVRALAWGVVLAATCAGGASALGEIVCEGSYWPHLQGIATDGEALYWSFTRDVVKTDLSGKALKHIEVQSHHGDPTYHDGKLYVPVNLRKFNAERGEADCWVYVYDARDLSLLSKHGVPEAVHGAGGMAYCDGRFFIVGGLPKGYQENYVYEYDADLKFVKRHVLESGYTLMGIQTANFVDGAWWFGCYGETLLKADASFRLIGKYRFDLGYGVIKLPDGRYLLGRCFDRSRRGKAVLGEPDAKTGMRVVTGPTTGPGTGVSRATTSPRDRPNIVWLTSEDTSPDLACYGTPLVKTPNLDRLASQGARYTNAFATGPVCSASRSGFMTGMYQTSIGAHQHRSHRKDGYALPEPVEVITEYFRRAGYYTANVTTPAPGVKGTGKTDFNFTPKRKPFDGTDWSRRGPGQPFFAHVNLVLTHRDFVRDKANPIDPAKVQLPPYYPDPPLARRDWADYLESIQVLDGQIGKVLDRLEREGLSGNTLVIYFGDHGRPHVRGKQWLYEGGIRVPLIVRWPGHVAAGAVVDDLVSLIDLAPTSLAAAGIAPPGHLQGNVFLGAGAKKRECVFAARDRCDETSDRIRCARTKRWKYIRNYHPDRAYTQFNSYKYRQYPVLALMQVLQQQGKLTPAQALFMAPRRPREELYDLEKDLHEIRNLCEDPGAAAVLGELRKALDAWIEQTKDRGAVAESESVLAAAKKLAESQQAKVFKRRGLREDCRAEVLLKYWEGRLLGGGGE